MTIVERTNFESLVRSHIIPIKFYIFAVEWYMFVFVHSWFVFVYSVCLHVSMIDQLADVERCARRPQPATMYVLLRVVLCVLLFITDYVHTTKLAT
jgi:hypothetical protein